MRAGRIANFCLLLGALSLSAGLRAEEGGAGPVDADPVVDATEIQQRGADNVEQALRIDPRVTQSGDGDLFLLGVDLSHWSVRWHGAPLLRTGDAQVDRVVLLRGDELRLRSGPSLSVFGESGTAGSIVIEPGERNLRPGLQIGSEIRGGAQARLRADAGLKLRAGRWRSNLQVTGLRDLQKPSLRVLAVRSRHRVTLSARASAELLVEQQLQISRELSVHRSLVQLGSEMIVGPQQRLVLRITRQDLRSSGSSRERGRRVELGETLLEARFLGALVEGHEVDLGLDARIGSGQRPLGSVRLNTRRSSAAVHVADRWHIRPNLRFDGSLRAEVDDVVGPTFSGRAALVYVLRPRWMLRGAVASVLRAPPLAQRWRQGPSRGVRLFPHVSDLAEQGQGVRLSFGYEDRDRAWALISYEPVTLDRTLAPEATRLTSTRGRLHTQWVGLNAGLHLWARRLRLSMAHYYMFDGRDDWSGRLLADRPNHLTRVHLRVRAMQGGEFFAHLELASPFSPQTFDLQAAPRVRGSAGVLQRLFGGVRLLLAADVERRLTRSSWSTAQGLSVRAALQVEGP